jgi:hypothetical protein
VTSCSIACQPVAMQLEHAGRRYAVQFGYSMPDSAWCVELSEAVPAPAAWADMPNSSTHMPGPAVVIAVVPDEDPDQEPTVSFQSGHKFPYEVMRWFMEVVAEEVQRCHAAQAGAHEGQ